MLKSMINLFKKSEQSQKNTEQEDYRFFLLQNAVNDLEERAIRAARRLDAQAANFQRQ